MARQAAESATALLNRLNPILNTSIKPVVEAHQAGWRPGTAGDVSDVQSVMIHSTEGWPTRDKGADMARWIYDSEFAGGKWGSSPHYYISGDGTVFKIFDENRVLWHGNEQNLHSIGIETGNLVSKGGPGGGAGGPWGEYDVPMYNWMPLTSAKEDLPNYKLYICRANGEIVLSYWAVNAITRADAEIPGTGKLMRFTEAQYWAWRQLSRYLSEVWRIPRNLSLHPFQTRAHMNGAANSEMFRAIVNGDASKERMLPLFAAAPIRCTTFDSDTAAEFRTRYAGQYVTGDGNPHNRFWRKMFDAFRGFHSHAYSGAIYLEDHADCAGPAFDYCRFARNLWDYWWFPFDLAPAVDAISGPGSTAPADTGVQVIETRRDYCRTRGTLEEYYWDSVPALYFDRTTSGFFPLTVEFGAPDFSKATLPEEQNHYYGYWHGGQHFDLTANTPIYAAAGGRVVAARFPQTYPAEKNRDDATNDMSSTRFVLMRHEVYHQRAAGGKRIDYNQEPSYVYSLYMHLGAPQGIDYARVIDANPEWLNRLVMLKNEYTAGIAFHTAHPKPVNQWGTLPDRWRSWQRTFDPLLTQLQAGSTVVFPEDFHTLDIALGDFLGNAGHLGKDNFAIHFEVFSAQNINPTQFTGHTVNPAGGFYGRAVQDSVTNWMPRPAVTATVPGYRAMRKLTPSIAASLYRYETLQFRSEWSLKSTDFGGAAWSKFQPMMWWDDVVPTMNAASGLPAGAALPTDGNVWHYHPLGFMAWINEVTWASELGKYRPPSPSTFDDRPPRRR